MSLRLYNSLTKREEPFVVRSSTEPVLSSTEGLGMTPADSDNVVTMYTCGPTVYGRPHIGNYSSFLMADLLRRWLEFNGYQVKQVKNITDVGHLLHDADQGDDKVEKEAAKEKVHPLRVAEKYTKEYLEDEAALHILEPFARPRATEYIAQMLEMIEVLLQKGIAYTTDDGIYFDVTKFPHYGALSGNTVENLNAGARVEVNEAKHHPADFALWKFCVGANADHVLRWKSPSFSILNSQFSIPDGFPGWHIECSAMSRALLGDTIDIHTGGEDNIFPHHECEIAQSESVTGKPFVRYFLHKRRIDLGTTKMSKSLGNVFSLPDIVAKGFDPLDLRYYLLSVHYRTRLKFTWKGMEDSKIARRKIVEWIEQVESWKPIRKNTDAESEGYDKIHETFIDAMNNDLNTSEALASIFTMMNFSRAAMINEFYVSANELEKIKKFIKMIRHTFGCFEPAVSESIPVDVQSLLDARAAARAGKDFAESDRLRAEIEQRGYEVRDTKGRQEVKRK